MHSGQLRTRFKYLLGHLVQYKDTQSTQVLFCFPAQVYDLQARQIYLFLGISAWKTLTFFGSVNSE